ncbi:MAG: hypothetical protein ABIR31_01330 [Ginsengibacter sp.]
MQHLITSFIIQSDTCSLPEIGRFKKVYSTASTDIANQQISPPREEIKFQERSENLSEELISYVAFKKQISIDDAGRELHDWCKSAKERLDNNESIKLESVGTLKMTHSGTLYFHPEETEDLPPVDAQRVIHQNSEHAVLVGDKESTNTLMNEYLNTEPEVKMVPWKKMAVVLALLALLLLVIYFRNYDAQNKFGNKSTFTAEPPRATYIAR